MVMIVLLTQLLCTRYSVGYKVDQADFALEKFINPSGVQRVNIKFNNNF